MKKLILSLSVLFTSLINAQEASHNSLNKGGAAISPAYANDIIIQNNPSISQRKVKLSVAFNGWLYSAYNTLDSANNAGGITIRSSKDNGVTWQTVDSYTVPNIRYTAHDIVVAGTDTSNLTLYLVGVRYDITSSTSVLFLDRYNATYGYFSNTPFYQANGTSKIYDVAIASDYKFPAVGASPYSVGFIYSSNAAKDSICSVVSIDGGATFSARQSVATTNSYYRNVSLSYGRSASASNGRYFAAWEQLNSWDARVGHIYSSRNNSTVNGPWNPQKNLDSISSTMINLCRNPQIATQFNNTDNDSAAVTAVVLVERDYIGDGSDYDLLGFYNKRAHFTNFWNRLDIVNSGENDMQPDISFDPSYNNFLAVYFDSTNKKLPYVVNGFNLTTPSTWSVVSAQYNDLSTNLKSPFPRVEINPVANKTAHAWVAEGVGTKGVAMFDAEYNYTSIDEISNSELTHFVSPNPVTNNASINFSLDKSADITITIYDALGQLVIEKYVGRSSIGNYSEKVNTSNWENGVYVYKISNGQKTFANRFIVAH
jgi:hypothetical protein